MATGVSKSKKHIELMIIVPLPEEHDALQEVFKAAEDLSDDEYVITSYSDPDFDLTIASVLQPGMGKKDAAETVRYIEERFDIGVYVVLGIAGSLNSDNNLGDVCYSGRIYDVTRVRTH